MNLKISLARLALAAAIFLLPLSSRSQECDSHGWLGTETLKSRFGDFQFKNGYPIIARKSSATFWS
jgi:hypothetical protein